MLWSISEKVVGMQRLWEQQNCKGNHTEVSKSPLFAYLSVPTPHACDKSQLKITFFSSFNDMHMYLQASPKVKGCNPSYHAAMAMGIWLQLAEQKCFPSEPCVQAYLYVKEMCVSNS